ncbi:unnamed protein product [Caenorhabditis nigoni]
MEQGCYESWNKNDFPVLVPSRKMAKTTTDARLTPYSIAMLWIFASIGFCCCLSSITGLIIFLVMRNRKKDAPVVINAAPAAAPAPVVIHKAAPKKSKKTSTMGGTSAMNTDLKSEDNDPGTDV